MTRTDSTRTAFRVDSPTVVSFSGGRTSALMLRMLLDAHGGSLPQDCCVVFANTGKEREETLRFVRDCETKWRVPIHWIEYRPSGFVSVDFDSASRNGEPFEMLIRKRNYLPNPVARFCTVELKILRIAEFMRARGHDEFDVLVGLRADEPARVSKVNANPSGGTKGITRRCPLYSVGITKADVSAYWSASSFDLELHNSGGTTPHGNCDLCFLKSTPIIISSISEDPARAAWWIRQEGSITNSSIVNGGRFRNDRPSYAQMLAFAQSQQDAFGFRDESIECTGCTD